MKKASASKRGTKTFRDGYENALLVYHQLMRMGAPYCAVVRYLLEYAEADRFALGLYEGYPDVFKEGPDSSAQWFRGRYQCNLAILRSKPRGFLGRANKTTFVRLF